MAMIDIFNDNAFGMVELSAAIEEIDYQPEWLGSLPIFTTRPVRTEHFAIEKRSDELVLVPTTPRGAALPQLTRGDRDLRDFRTVRVAKGDRLTASEIANIRAFGSDTELEQAQQEVADRMARIRADIELTHENMRLGAIQGKVVDADGSVIYDWFSQWGIATPAVKTFNFTTLVDGGLRKFLTGIIREMTRAGKGSFTNSTQIYAIAGDEFYDALIMAKEVRDTYLGWAAAADLRSSGLPWEVFQFGGINWVNYRGTDPGGKASVAVASTDAIFFPVGAPGAFMRINSPGESFDVINTPGQDFYARTIPDKDRNEWVDIEVLSYVMYVAAKPGMLRKGRLA